MAVPRKRVSKMNKNNRRMHLKVSVPLLVNCKNCSNHCLQHVICSSCGYYRGKQV